MRSSPLIVLRFSSAQRPAASSVTKQTNSDLRVDGVARRWRQTDAASGQALLEDFLGVLRDLLVGRQ